MNLKELKDIVDHYYDHCVKYRYGDAEQHHVGVEVHTVGSVGGTPIVSVKSAQSGIDWDQNKFIIRTDVPLREIGRDEIKSLHENYEELGWKLYEIQNLKRENKKLKEQVDKLKSELAQYKPPPEPKPTNVFILPRKEDKE